MVLPINGEVRSLTTTLSSLRLCLFLSKEKSLVHPYILALTEFDFIFLSQFFLDQ